MAPLSNDILKTSLSSVLKTLMSAVKINASELARRTGIAQPIIHRLLTGKNTNPKLNTILPIAKYFMINVSQLVGELPLPADDSFYRVSSDHRAWKQVPLIAWDEVAAWPALMDQYQRANDSTYISTDVNVSNQAYSLKIKGCAMEPMFPEGTIIIVEPNRQPSDRDFVVVQLNGDSEARLKQVLIDGSDYYLKSLNPDLEDIKVSRLTDTYKFLGVMAQARVDY